MSSRTINGILLAVIAVVAGGIVFFGVRELGRDEAPPVIPQQQFPQPADLGKTPKERDMSMEQGVRALNDAVVAYAADHKGSYPESDLRNPCSGVRICLKGVDINTKEKVYLLAVPQTPGWNLDYYYRADNAAKTYCVQAPAAFETETAQIFQCTEHGCGTFAVAEACR